MERNKAMSEIGIFDINFDTGDRYWSFELKRMLGVRHDVPAEFHLLLQRIHPDDRRTFGRNAMQPFRCDCPRHSSIDACMTMAACSGKWNGERSCEDGSKDVGRIVGLALKSARPQVCASCMNAVSRKPEQSGRRAIERHALPAASFLNVRR
jgi:hypothetical protein